MTESVRGRRLVTPGILLWLAPPPGYSQMGLGLSDAGTASRLHVSLSTAKTHVGRKFMKFGARDRAGLVIAACNTGLVRRL